MRTLIVKATGEVLGAWPSGQQALMSTFDEALHEWDENAPEDLVIDDAALYTKSGGEYVKAAKPDENAELKAEIISEVDAKILASKVSK